MCTCVVNRKYHKSNQNPKPQIDRTAYCKKNISQSLVSSTLYSYTTYSNQAGACRKESDVGGKSAHPTLDRLETVLTSVDKEQAGPFYFFKKSR